MIAFISTMGPFGILLIIIALYIIYQVVRKGVQLFSSREPDLLKLELGIH